MRITESTSGYVILAIIVLGAAVPILFLGPGAQPQEDWPLAQDSQDQAAGPNSFEDPGDPERTLVILGRGRTNALYVDADGDGYGTASPLGPDADDANAKVNTPRSLRQKAPASAATPKAGRIIYVRPDPKTHEPIGEKPLAEILPGLEGGDTVIFAGGTYRGQITINCQGLLGKKGKPIVLKAAPGEKAILDATEAAIRLDKSSNVIIEGFICDDTSEGHYSNGIALTECSDVTLRDIECRGSFWGVVGMQNLRNVTLERMVIHDIVHEHGIYLGSRDMPNEDITIRDCLIYRCSQQGIQHNGRVTGLTIERNIIHTNGQAGIQFIQGVSKSFVSNNLIFNNAKQGIVLYNYDSTDAAIAAFDQCDNLFEHNTVWIGTEDWHDEYPTRTYAAVLFNDDTGRKKGAFTGNVFRGNILVTSEGAAFQFHNGKFGHDTVIEDNLIFRTAGKECVMKYGQAEHDFDSFAKFSGTYKGNCFADPLFMRAKAADYLSPWKFDLRPAAKSPAVGMCGAVTSTSATSTTAQDTDPGIKVDLCGSKRVADNWAGCYQADK